jgi:hypothetical protein
VAEADVPIDEFPLEQIGQLHGIAAGMFVPFAIHRLSQTAGQTMCDLQVELVGIGGVPHAFRQLRLTWQAESVLALPPGIQENAVTEWAALGIAAAVVWRYAGVRIVATAEEGERLDYWLTDGERRFGLEVSGTLTGDVVARHRKKVRQLLENPVGTDGYVVVVGFDGNRVAVSFRQFPEAKP